MASETPKPVRMWSFRQAPPEFQRLFPEGSDSDWIAHVPESDRPAVEPSLVQWRPVYAVQLVELKDRSAVFLGAPREALEMILEHGEPVTGSLLAGQERRAAIRVRLECPSQYKTPKQMGFGHTVDMSRTGIAFTTDGLLARDSEITLRVTWPVRLEGGVPVLFYAVGKLARAETMKAAMQMDSFGFSIEA